MKLFSFVALAAALANFNLVAGRALPPVEDRSLENLPRVETLSDTVSKHPAVAQRSDDEVDELASLFDLAVRTTPQAATAPATDKPLVPSGKDVKKFHVWQRLDTITKTYIGKEGASMDELNKLMKDTGGQHVDLVVGNPDKFQAIGLKFKDKSWLKMNNGDGAPVVVYTETYEEIPGQKLKYLGQVASRMTIGKAESKGVYSINTEWKRNVLMSFHLVLQRKH